MMSPVGTMKPSDFHPFRPHKKHLAGDLKQKLTCSKLSPPGYKHLTQSSSVLGYNPCSHFESNASVSMVTKLRSNVYHVLPMCHESIEVKIKF